MSLVFCLDWQYQKSRVFPHVLFMPTFNLSIFRALAVESDGHSLKNDSSVVGSSKCSPPITSTKTDVPTKTHKIPAITPVPSLPSHIKLDQKTQGSVDRLEKLKKERASVEDFEMADKKKIAIGNIYALLIASNDCQSKMCEAAAAEDYDLASQLKSERDLKRMQTVQALLEVEKQFVGSID